MFQAFTIKNFRCFEDFRIDSLDRVNLITGLNNVGKTALLEAIFLHLGRGNPLLVTTVDMFRGFIKTQIETIETWEWLFSGLITDKEIAISGKSKKGLGGTLSIRLTQSPATQFDKPVNGGTDQPPKAGQMKTSDVAQELVFEFQGPNEKGTSKIQISGTNVSYVPATLSPLLGILYGLQWRSPKEDAERLSGLDDRNAQGELIEFLQILEPKLKRVAVHVSSGMRVPLIKADVGGSRMVPVALMGEGLNRLLSIFLSMADLKNKFLLIDEFENGIHHSVLLDVWKGVAHAARKYDVQVFATTHSWECVRAAHQAFTGTKPYDLRLHRLERVNGAIKAFTFNEETLGTAIERNMEVR